jgi:integrase
LKATSKDMTVAIQLQRLHLVIADMAPPNENWRWLYLASQRLFKRAEPREHQKIDVEPAFARGEEKMRRAQREADDYGYVSEGTAKTFRKGLELSWKCVMPDRLRADQSLRLGESIKRSGDGWRIILEGKYTKNKRRISRRVPPKLCPWITDYVERFRPAIPGATTHNGFWAASSGKPMSRSTIYQSIKATTNAELGTSLSSHDFRRIVATHWKEIAPDQPDKARRHLTHASYQITRKHYVDPSGHAGRGLISAWKPYKRKPNSVVSYPPSISSS